jgi:hypothetical protein
MCIPECGLYGVELDVREPRRLLARAPRVHDAEDQRGQQQERRYRAAYLTMLRYIETLYTYIISG